jgi:hypothetical protein
MAAPCARLSQLANAGGNAKDALGWAEEASARSSANVEVMLTLAAVRAGMLKDHADGASDVLKLLDRVASVAPANPDILPLRVRALGAAGRKDQAIAAANVAISATPPSDHRRPPPTLLRQRRVRAGLEAQLTERCQQLHGNSPQLALFIAHRKLSANDKAGAVEVVRAGRTASAAAAGAASQQSREWDLALARTLEAVVDPPRRARGWRLRTRTRATRRRNGPPWARRRSSATRSSLGRLLDRINAQFGDRGLRYRVSRARWCEGR